MDAASEAHPPPGSEEDVLNVAGPLPSGLHSLPKDLVVAILRAYNSGCPTGLDLTRAYDSRSRRAPHLPSSLLPLRAVSRAFRDAVDEAVEELHCCFKFHRRDEALRQRMGLWLQCTPSRCPNLRHLILQFHWSFDYLEHALCAVGQSCPRLQSLELHAETVRKGLQGDSRSRSLSALSSLSALNSLTLKGFGMYPEWEQRLRSAVPSLTHLVLRVVGKVELEVPPGLATLDIFRGTGRWHNSILSTQLKKLTLTKVSLAELLQVPGTVQELTISNMREGGLAPALQLPNLEDLCLSRTGIRWLPSLSQSSRLQKIKLHEVDYLTTLPDLSHLSMLRTVDLVELRISSLQGLGRLSQLQLLCLSRCIYVTSLRGLSDFTRLETLSIDSLTRLTSLSDIAGLCSLQHLSIKCSKLELSDVLPCLRKLERLHLHETGCPMHPLPNLISLTQLHKLEITWNRHIIKLPDLSSLVALQDLILEFVLNLESVSGSLLPASLRTLIVIGTSKVNNLDGVIPPNLKRWQINRTWISTNEVGGTD